ncbi:BZ3500_MvSof-1268-A1-R1_Chr5-2g07965 [Microbotryum saponariae]|uniref:BZ3500_MvSof-1268-A1-R1_Chr5-2g07965 protein n=1 Tax=Microbotryum saponariae TaxID=289078 RepID=A0A2X0KIM4_9BASI|nr:BZ3500_MvSof-1268-A1-R1_Chr5-2g07965 [Microbotryum saponariae]SDA05834.1 BZ3501_MvSof-1269-A2-R1_Chr5-2g07787 [Microbotryum saponariae]
MGVPTFWKELEAAEERDTIMGIATTKFQSSPGVRGFRLGIDASLWLFVSQIMMRTSTTKLSLAYEVWSQHIRKVAAMDASEVGANADVRTFFFRIVELLSQGCLLIFVFDGPGKPNWKRGKRIGGGGPGFGNTNKKEDVLIRRLIDLFGMRRRIAPGEAEAELAAMAVRGEIDAVLTVIRNPPKTGKLAGPTPSKAEESAVEEPSLRKLKSSTTSTTTSKDARRIYTSLNILDTLELDQESLILVALLSGGDYHPQGVAFVGPRIGCALARCGFGRSLLRCLELHRDGSAEQKQAFADWRAEVAEELRTDTRKFLMRKAPKLSQQLPGQTDFPNPEIVRHYTSPNVSSGLDPPVWDTPVNLKQLVLYCSENFEWGNADVRARFRSLVYKPLLMLEIRRRALYDDRTADRIVPEAPYRSEYEGPLFAEVRDLKNADSTQNVLSYRVRLDPLPFSTLIDEALPAIDPYPRAEVSEGDFDADGSLIKQRRALKDYGDSISPFMHWVPVAYVEAHPDGREAVKKWEDKKANPSPRKKKAPIKTVPVVAAAKGKGAPNTLMFKATKGGVAKAQVGSKGKEKKKEQDLDGGKTFFSPTTSPIKTKTRRTLFTVGNDPESEPFVIDDEEDEPSVRDNEDDSDGDLPDPKSIGAVSWLPHKVIATAEHLESPTKKIKVAPPPTFLVVDDDEGSEGSGGEELEVRELGNMPPTPSKGRALRREARSEERWGKCEVLEVSP